jgi:DNA (cytosine-5)-methyltransferase 1
MTHGSLFSGIGGFDLAAEWMGWQNVFHCEWNPFGQKVLKYYWPQAESFTDITKTDFKKYANKIDILTGGFPCQPYSSAGKRLGKADERHLWPEMLRAIRELEPTYIVGENVRGLLNWNGGMVFDEVCAELENLGYQVAPCLIPACGVGAPHRRERIWFVAYSKSAGAREDIGGIRGLFKRCHKREEVEPFVADTNSNGLEGSLSSNLNKQISSKEKTPCRKGSELTESASTNGTRWSFTNTDNTRFQTFDNKKSELGQKSRAKTFGGNCFESIHSRNWWENFPTQSPVCVGNDGISDRLDGIAFSKWRNESIKSGGNAIVPQVAFQIFQTIQKLHNDLYPMQAHNA